MSKKYKTNYMSQQREIKFRAWDKMEKKMCAVGIVNFEKGAFLIGNSPTPAKLYSNRSYQEEISEGHFVMFEYMELLEYTGLKDKNGKEIYEGDVVRRTFDFLEVQTSKYILKTETSFIVYRNNGFWVNDEGFGWDGEDLWDWDEIEVIGNLHENPELIQQTEEIK